MYKKSGIHPNYKNFLIFIIVLILGFAKTAPYAKAEVLWEADFEEGNLGELDKISNSGSPDVGIQQDIVHTGQYAAFARTYSKGDGVRFALYKQSNDPSDPKSLPDEAYYSAWYYFPQFVSGNNNIFQWKQAQKTGSNSQTKRKLYSLNLRDMVPHLNQKLNFDGTHNTSGKDIASYPLPAPVKEWFHIEAFYKWAPNGNGVITFWMNGAKMFTVTDITTWSNVFEWISYPRQWTVNNYKISSGGTSPVLIYIDDVVLSTQPISKISPTPPYNSPTNYPTPSGPPGDGNGDYQVDGKDFIIWLIHFGQNVSGPPNGDYNDSGEVEIGDYTIWINNYGS